MMIGTQQEDRRNHHRGNFKTNVHPDEARRALNNEAIQLRKDKQGRRIRARRDLDLTVSSPTRPSNAPSAGVTELLIKCMTSLRQRDPRSWLTLDDGIYTALREIRKLTCLKDQNPPLGEILELGFPAFALLALQAEDARIQFETAWVLTNITAADDEIFTKAIAEYAGLVKELVRLVGFGTTPSVRYQCAWCIGNIAERSSCYRAGLLEMEDLRFGFVQNIIKPETDQLLGTFVWALSNVLKQSSDFDATTTKSFVPVLIRKLGASSIEKESLRVDICNCLQLLAEGEVGSGRRVQPLLEFGALPVLMKVLGEELQPKRPSPRVLVPLTRCIGMFAAGNSQQTDAVLCSGFLESVPRLLSVNNQKVLKEALWVLSNIAAGTPQHAMVLSSHRIILKDLVDASLSENWMTRREGLWTICNLLSVNIIDITRAVHSSGAILLLCYSVPVPDADLLCAILEGLDVLLTYDATLPHGNMPIIVEEEGTLAKIENLLNHKIEAVYDRAYKLIQTHCPEPDIADEDQNICPDTNANASFDFGLSQSGLAENGQNIPKWNFGCDSRGTMSAISPTDYTTP